jgi:hypothetical protein
MLLLTYDSIKKCVDFSSCWKGPISLHVIFFLLGLILVFATHQAYKKAIVAMFKQSSLHFLLDKVHEKMPIKFMCLQCSTVKEILWWWTPRTQAFCLKDVLFSIKFTIAINNTCLIASFEDVQGFFTSPKVDMRPLIISLYATTSFESDYLWTLEQNQQQ